MATRRRALSPSVLIRRRALHKGILGPSRMWRAIAFVVFGRKLLKRIFGKNVDELGTEKLTAGQLVQIEAIAPPTRRKRRRPRVST
ncbi:MAG: hypothetical protein ACRDZZ_09460 [Ilumatobacteraceae bacterium]